MNKGRRREEKEEREDAHAVREEGKREKDGRRGLQSG